MIDNSDNSPLADQPRELPFLDKISFHSQHSPMGAYMSLTMGHVGSAGGIGVQLGGPANQQVYVGVKEGARYEEAQLKCLPFFAEQGDPIRRGSEFLVEQALPEDKRVAVWTYGTSTIRRQFGWATDRWITDDFSFTIYTPFGAIPDPTVATPSELRQALAPAVIAELEIDNTRGTRAKTGFFSLQYKERGWRAIGGKDVHAVGFAHRSNQGVLGTVIRCDGHERVAPELFCRWTPNQGIAQPVPHLLGYCPGLSMEVPAGERRILRLAIGCYLGGTVTYGKSGRYLYTKFFDSLEDVLNHALAGDRKPQCDQLDRRLLQSGLSSAQQFLVAHATRGYYGNTQLLEVEGKPFWIVNEGEYCMMNTLDLCVDQVFWEMSLNPWVVRNLLDNFVNSYSYEDRLKREHSDDAPVGGLSFAHDMGAFNMFSPPGQSSYELPNLDAVCFSHMTAEQLCNWVLMAVTYVSGTNDLAWAKRNRQVFSSCLKSLCNRSGESGIPELDSAHCGSGAEITTYDSLDHSLAQTRQSLYMGVKFWATFVGLASLFKSLNSTKQYKAAQQAARRAEQTLLKHVSDDGTLPAIFEQDRDGYQSRILPACEGLLYPHMWGIESKTEAPELFGALKRHVLALLHDPQRRNCFADGGIRLSSTSRNSWMSKIAIFQHVARKVFRLDADPRIAALFENADRAHVAWQIDGGGYWGCSDQFVEGVAKGSRWYPRTITTALWMSERSAATAAVAQPQDKAQPVVVVNPRIKRRRRDLVASDEL
jgi:hypothetical protein